MLDPGADSPAGNIADRHVHADYLDAAGLARLSSIARAATTEFENVPAAALEFLARTARVSPAAATVAIAQDRIREKGFLAEHGFAVAPYAVLATAREAAAVDASLVPGIVKSARFGYDGKGQIRVTAASEVASAFRAMGNVPCVLERFVDLACEVSVIVARDAAGATATWPVAENRHRDGILDVAIVPARVPPELADQARSVATRVAAAASTTCCCGSSCSSMGALPADEIAPRRQERHDVIDARDDFARRSSSMLAGLPLRERQHSQPVVMVSRWVRPALRRHRGAAASRQPDWPAALATASAESSTARPQLRRWKMVTLPASRLTACAGADVVEFIGVVGIPGAQTRSK